MLLNVRKLSSSAGKQGKFIVKALVAGLCLSGSFFSASALAQPEQQPSQQGPEYQLMLIGGGLKICSSMDSMNCNLADWFDRDQMRMDRYINLGGRYRAAALDDSVWPALRRPMRDRVSDALDTVYDRVKEKVIPERVFVEEFTRRANRHLYSELSDAEWNRIIDHLEMPVPEGMSEQANISDNLNKASREIVKRFVALAAEVRSNKGDDEKPEILVITAGSRDPLHAADLYLSVFENAGATTTWLPMDAAVAEAQRDNGCDKLDSYRPKALGSWDRARVHSQRHETQVSFCKNENAWSELLGNADAVFFAGDNQNLVRKAFLNQENRPTELLRAIYSAVQSKTLVVGANAGGTAAITARPMITNGTSRAAMIDGAISSEPPPFNCHRDNSCPQNLDQNSLTYHPLGGLGLFPYATLDTEFSELGRHARMLRVAATTSTPMAVGIDANTALMVNLMDSKFRVFGERGVFFSMTAQQTDAAVASAFHYLLDGSHGTISDSDISDVQLSDNVGLITAEPSTKFMAARGSIDALRLLCSERNQMRLVEDAFTMILQVDDASTTKKTGGECQILNGRIGVMYDAPKQF
ncbi:MAG: cyanophycinase [Idiomarina sp.]